MTEKPKNLAQALIAFQRSVPKIVENDKGFHGGFANLPGVLSQINPALREAGLAVSQAPDHIDGVPALRTIIIHEASGEQYSSVTPLVINKGKNDTQEWGKAVTYTRRYALQAALNICVGIEDNDSDMPEQSKPAPAIETQQQQPIKKADKEPLGLSFYAGPKREDLENELIDLLQKKMAKGQTLEYLDDKAAKWNLVKGGSRVQQMNIDQLQSCIDELRSRKDS